MFIMCYCEREIKIYFIQIQQIIRYYIAMMFSLIAESYRNIIADNVNNINLPVSLPFSLF